MMLYNFLTWKSFATLLCIIHPDRYIRLEEMPSLLKIDDSGTAAFASFTPLEQKQRLFVIRDDCFWCASAIRTRNFELEFCPQCTKPISMMGYQYSVS